MRSHGRFSAQARSDDPEDAATGRDEQLGRIFSNMRLVMKASRELIARRLAVAVSTVDSFEAGVVAAFPHWRETERIVRTYCELLRLDPEPILWRIRGQLQQLPSSERRSRAGPGRPRAQPRLQPVPVRAGSERPRAWRGRGRVLFALGAPVALAAIVLSLARLAPTTAYRSIALLPGLLREPARAGLDQLILFTAPQRDGLRWVDVSDPRTRKANKLQSGSR